MASVTRFIRGHFSPCNEVDQFGLTVLHLRQEFFCLQLSLYPTYKVTKNLGLRRFDYHRLLNCPCGLLDEKMLCEAQTTLKIKKGISQVEFMFSAIPLVGFQMTNAFLRCLFRRASQSTRFWTTTSNQKRLPRAQPARPRTEKELLQKSQLDLR